MKASTTINGNAAWVTFRGVPYVTTTLCVPFSRPEIPHIGVLLSVPQLVAGMECIVWRSTTSGGLESNVRVTATGTDHSGDMKYTPVPEYRIQQ